MAKIVITEVDDTTPQGIAQSTDIVYIPGFANTNANCFILSIPSATPVHPDGATTATALVGSTGGSANPKREDYNAHKTAPQYCVNIYDHKAWYYDTEEEDDWAEVESYVEPFPENSPTLCNTVSEFIRNFGELPYKFVNPYNPTTEAADYSDYQASHMDYPTFCINPSASSPTTYSMAYSNGDYEKSYIIARELVSAGIPVLYENFVSRTGSAKDAPSVKSLYKNMKMMFENISDIGEYSVKYITSGAYPVFEVSDQPDSGSDTYSKTAVALCKASFDRGDSVSFADHCDAPGRPLTGDGSVFNCVGSSSSIFKKEAEDGGAKEYGAYCAMLTPYASYKCVAQSGDLPVESRKQILPASFAYLVSLAKSIKTNANWLAVSGVSRGLVPNIISLNTTQKLTNKIADTYQPKTDVAINAVTNIQPYGLTIWGNRTLFANTANGLQAHSFLNTRNMVNEIKKVAYNVAKSLMFEQNSESLWLAFKSGLLPVLNQMQSGQGLTAYKIIRQETSEKYKMSAVIKLYPIYAVEEIEVNIYLENEEITVQ